MKKILIYYIRENLYNYKLILKLNSKEDRNRKAQILKALAHPIRLYIVEVLLEGERCVNDIRDLFDVSQPNISQHLSILKFSGIVEYRQVGNLRCYFLKNPERIKKIIQDVKGLANI